MNMTYSFDTCTEIMNCESYIELQLALYDKNQEAYYDSEAITPNNVIEYSPAVVTKQIFFDLDGTKERFALALTGRSMDACFALSRVLVYRQMCPDQDECKGISYNMQTLLCIITCCLYIFSFLKDILH